MVATSDLGSDAERRGGSSPFVRTQSRRATKVVRLFLCASKGARTRCGGSADLSAMIDCASCNTTTNIGRALVAQASLALTLTPYSIPTVFRPIITPWSALALLNAVRVPRSATLIVK